MLMIICTVIKIMSTKNYTRFGCRNQVSVLYMRLMASLSTRVLNHQSHKGWNQKLENVQLYGYYGYKDKQQVHLSMFSHFQKCGFAVNADFVEIFQSEHCCREQPPKMLATPNKAAPVLRKPRKQNQSPALLSIFQWQQCFCLFSSSVLPISSAAISCKLTL